jgi:hypothetical protein
LEAVGNLSVANCDIFETAQAGSAVPFGRSSSRASALLHPPGSIPTQFAARQRSVEDAARPLIKLFFNYLKTMIWRFFRVYIRHVWLLELWFRSYSEEPFTSA